MVKCRLKDLTEQAAALAKGGDAKATFSNVTERWIKTATMTMKSSSITRLKGVAVAASAPDVGVQEVSGAVEVGDDLISVVDKMFDIGDAARDGGAGRAAIQHVIAIRNAAGSRIYINQSIALVPFEGEGIRISTGSSARNMGNTSSFVVKERSVRHNGVGEITQGSAHRNSLAHPDIQLSYRGEWKSFGI